MIRKLHVTGGGCPIAKEGNSLKDVRDLSGGPCVACCRNMYDVASVAWFGEQQRREVCDDEIRKSLG